jgi:hypothetical protein
MTDHPLEDLVESANRIIDKGGIVYQKWTCEACGERAAGTEPNVFHTSMVHQDCPVDPNHITKTPTGNYVAVMPGNPDGVEAVRKLSES